MNNTKPCRRCLLSDLDEGEFFRTLKEYISDFPQEKRVPEEEYRRRLGLCTECDELISGMCRICGCYVELRALKKYMRCPRPDPAWQEFF